VVHSGCYATSIHKSQGSEYPAVVIPLSTQHYMMLKRNLVYTGITRGKRLVVLVGQKRALAIAVKGQQVERRWSKLQERLREGADPINAQRPGGGLISPADPHPSTAARARKRPLDSSGPNIV
jgi:hypothetical protein